MNIANSGPDHPIFQNYLDYTLQTAEQALNTVPGANQYLLNPEDTGAPVILRSLGQCGRTLVSGIRSTEILHPDHTTTFGHHERLLIIKNGGRFVTYASINHSSEVYMGQVPYFPRWPEQVAAMYAGRIVVNHTEVDNAMSGHSPYSIEDVASLTNSVCALLRQQKIREMLPDFIAQRAMGAV